MCFSSTSKAMISSIVHLCPGLVFRVTWIQCMWVCVRWSVSFHYFLTDNWVQLHFLEDSYRNVSESLLHDKSHTKCLQAWTHLVSNRTHCSYYFPPIIYTSTERLLPQITQPLNQCMIQMKTKANKPSLNLCIPLPLRLLCAEWQKQNQLLRSVEHIVYKVLLGIQRLRQYIYIYIYRASQVAQQ